VVDGVSIHRTRFSASTPQEAFEFVERAYTRARPRVHPDPAGFEFEVVAATGGGLSCDRIRTSVGAASTSEPFDGDLAVLTCVRGRLRYDGGRYGRAGCTPGVSCLYPERDSVRCEWDGCEVDLLRLPREQVARVAAERTGVRPESVRFLGMSPISVAAQGHWRAAQALVAGRLLDHRAPTMPPLAHATLLDVLALSLLTVFPSTVTTCARPAGAGWVAPSAVRRAEEFIGVHASLPITLTDVANAAGTSPIALQNAFVRAHDTTVLGYLRRVRLEAAHGELQAGRTTSPGAAATAPTVAEIAARWSFAGPDRFADQYRRRYGTSPEETLGSRSATPS